MTIGEENGKGGRERKEKKNRELEDEREFLEESTLVEGRIDH